MSGVCGGATSGSRRRLVQYSMPGRVGTMLELPTDDSLAWAEVCLDHAFLEKRARHSGHLDQFRLLTQAARADADAMDDWRRLVARIEEHERVTGEYVVRD